MSRIKSANTKPELIVRSMVHQMGYRFRLHQKQLPGRPDLVLPKHRSIIFVHGCFWHCHRCRFGRVKPATNAEFWAQKRGQNVLRDRRNLKSLRQQGWQVLVVWECWTRTPERLYETLSQFFESESELTVRS